MTYRGHLDLVFAPQQEPSGKHANEIRTQSGPWFIVQLVEECKWILYSEIKINQMNNSNEFTFKYTTKFEFLCTLPIFNISAMNCNAPLQYTSTHKHSRYNIQVFRAESRKIY